MKRREDAAQAYVNGRVEPLRQLATESQHATFFGLPEGAFAKEPTTCLLAYEHAWPPPTPKSVSIRSGVSSFEILQMGVSGDVGFWAGFQHAKARMHGSSKIIPMTLRVTEVFRREGREWRLVHRHADALAAEAK